MRNSSSREPTVAITDWIAEGKNIFKKHLATFLVASFLAVLTTTLIFIALFWEILRIFPIRDGIQVFIPWARFLMTGVKGFLLMTLFGAFYAGLVYMGLKSMRGETPRVRDFFRGFERCWGVFLIWLIFPISMALIGGSGAFAILFTPFLWAIGMLALPLYIDRKLSVSAAMSTAFETVFTSKNWWRFWLYGIAMFCTAFIGFALCGIGVCYTLPLSVCAQMIAYNEVCRPGEIVPEAAKPSVNQPLIAQIWELRDRILEAIDSADEGVKPLLESSVEQIGGVVSKATDLVDRLDQIDEYLETTSEKSLRRERAETEAKLAAAGNAGVALQYEEVLKALRDRLANHERLSDLAAKIRAQLITIRISLDNTLARIVQIKSADISNASLERDGFTRDLENLRIEMDVLLDSLDEMERSSR